MNRHHGALTLNATGVPYMCGDEPTLIYWWAL